jgi:hypothetical protein
VASTHSTQNKNPDPCGPVDDKWLRSASFHTHGFPHGYTCSEPRVTCTCALPYFLLCTIHRIACLCCLGRLVPLSRHNPDHQDPLRRLLIFSPTSQQIFLLYCTEFEYIVLPFSSEAMSMKWFSLVNQTTLTVLVPRRGRLHSPALTCAAAV